MEHAPCISQIATLLADPKRSAMMWALMDGSARATEELALLAGLSPSSASAHLGRLSAGGLLRVESRGRKRFFRLAAPEIGAAIEALASATFASAPQDIPEVFKRNAPLLKPRAVRSSLLSARLCDDHLGGPCPPTCISDCWKRAGSSIRISGSRSRSRARRSWRHGECSSRRWPIATAGLPARALIGAKDARTWAARWGPPCCSCSCSRGG